MNPSGIKPTEYKVLVKPEDVELKTKGGIFIPDATADKEKFAQIKGRLVAASPAAFSDWGLPPDDTPKPGDLVMFAKYAGINVKGRDGAEYRIIQDKDVAAVCEE